MSVGMRIREANRSELEMIKRMTIRELHRELDDYEEQFAAEAERVFVDRLNFLLGRNGNEIFVAEVGEEMVGYVWFGVSERPLTGMKIGWIYDIQVLPSYRGKGIGEALMKYALDLSRRRGFQVAGLMVNARNRVAASLYAKLGFRTDYMLMFRQEAKKENPSPTPID